MRRSQNSIPINGQQGTCPIKLDTNIIVMKVMSCYSMLLGHDDVITWKQFPRYGPFVRGIHRSPVNSPHKGQWHGALVFSFICAWINASVNHREAGDLRRHRAIHDVIVMQFWNSCEFARKDIVWIILETVVSVYIIIGYRGGFLVNLSCYLDKIV